MVLNKLWPVLTAWVRRLMLTADDMVPQGISIQNRLYVERRMLNLLVQSMRQVLLTSIVIGPLLTAWLTWPHVGAARSALPMLALFALGAERVHLLRRMRRVRAEQDDQPRRWARALAKRAGLGSCIIATWFYFALASGDHALVSQMVALLTILSAGAAALFSSWPPVMWAVVSPMLLGMAAQLAVFGGADRLVEAVFCVVLWIVLVSASLRSARTLHKEALAVLNNRSLMRELNKRHARAEAATAAKLHFFAAANHDLRQPLQAMSMYLSMLESEASAQLRDAEAMARIRQCIVALDGTLESLLNFARMDSGQTQPELRTFALQPLFHHLETIHAPSAQEKKLQLRVRTTNAWVYSDPALLERALSNLLGNALRYTQSGGVLLAARKRGEHLRICVIDTGVGIPKTKREIIYEEFVQLDNPEHNSDLGYGLGLATVRRIASLLDLRLKLHSRVGHGSVFTLDVSSAEPDQAADTPATIQRPEHRLAGRVLVVEDNMLVQEALTQQLRQWGLDVTAVQDGATACTLMETIQFDVVLSDWRLAGDMDGLNVLQVAREQLPQLRLGALITGEDIQQLRQFDAQVPILRKPLRPLRLRALLAQSLKTGSHPR